MGRSRPQLTTTMKLTTLKASRSNRMKLSSRRPIGTNSTAMTMGSKRLTARHKRPRHPQRMALQQRQTLPQTPGVR